jgi:hypothetical protein
MVQETQNDSTTYTSKVQFRQLRGLFRASPRLCLLSLQVGEHSCAKKLLPCGCVCSWRRFAYDIRKQALAAVHDHLHMQRMAENDPSLSFHTRRQHLCTMQRGKVGDTIADYYARSA